MIKKLIKDNFLENKTILITGTTSGIGLEAITHLSKYNCHIIACVRNTSLAIQQLDKLKIKNPTFSFSVYPLDLQDINSINNLVNTLKKDSIKLPYIT